MLQQATNARQTLSYDMLIPAQEPRYKELQALMKANKLRVLKSSISKSSSGISYS